MKAIFVDTAGWVAAADAADSMNEAVRQARDGWIEAGGLLVTTDLVCVETLTVLRFRLGLPSAEAWWKQVEASRRVRFEDVDDARSERARAMFFRYKDKDFSFVDCTSFVVMKELRVDTALTLDSHFSQMGFRVIP